MTTPSDPRAARAARVHATSVRLPWWSMCSTPQPVIVDAGGTLLESAAFVVVPAQAQCKDCRWLASLTLSGPISATPIHILSSCLFCGAIAGALPIEARRLIAAYCAGDADALLALADLVEERGLTGPHAQWAEERQGWLEVTEHEHVWRKWYSGDRQRATSECVIPGDLDWIRRCTCGLFEHETGPASHDDGIASRAVRWGNEIQFSPLAVHDE